MYMPPTQLSAPGFATGFSRAPPVTAACVSACRLRRAPTTRHCRLGGPKAIPRADRSKLARARRLEANKTCISL